MKINQVEELVGITKKNIRFYEEQGLLNPSRNPENGYREYSLEDVKELTKIKLLRKLSVPIEEIRSLQEGKIDFGQCMEQHIITLNRQQRDLELTKELCSEMMTAVGSLQDLDADQYLEEIQNLEEKGTRFMDIEKRDIRKKKVGPIIAAVVCSLFMLGVVGVMIWAYTMEPIPLGFMALILLPVAAVIVGILIALGQRLREIDRGEEDEARQY
ncbi:MAG: MerR family transcriptional regulator [Acetatifactor sp.]|nr:MerR family transcriptional regulator [Acetatifactor sp.]